MFKLIAIVSLLIASAYGQACVVTVPQNPLTTGLSQPWFITGCNQTAQVTASFVQGAIVDVNAGTISVYNPLMINMGSTTPLPIVPPTLNAGSVVGLWFGTNGNTLQLQADAATGLSLGQGLCVNGLPGSIFGQFSYCNAPAFFAAANALIAAGKIVVPPLGTALDGLTCPTVRDFSVVDMDQSDNVVTTYLVSGNNLVQNTKMNQQATGGNPVIVFNGSDNRLLAVALAGALGCTPYTAPDLADPGQVQPAVPLNELSAAAHQQMPIAVIPLLDPMTLNNGVPSLVKTNLYRVGVNQIPARNNFAADTNRYCAAILATAPARIVANQFRFLLRGSPDPNAAENLYGFLLQRLSATLSAAGLNCVGFLGIANPVTFTLGPKGLPANGTIFIPAVVNANVNCNLLVPANPLTATGLSTPYQLSGNGGNGPCNMGNAGQTAFVHGAVLDPATGIISVYNPLIIDQGSAVKAAPIVPTLPAGAIVALWFGFNGNNLQLMDANGGQTLTAANCVNGGTNPGAGLFGEFSYCNAVQFFATANQLIAAGKIVVPPLGIASDGLPCPTVRDFSVVDMDQSDNVPTTYLLIGGVNTVQNTAANRALFAAANPIANPSDNRLVDVALDTAYGCNPWQVADLADPGAFQPALPLNELQAAAFQGQPPALVPANDPMTINQMTKLPDVQKMNAYRVGVNQLAVATTNNACTLKYCQRMNRIQGTRMANNAALFSNFASLDGNSANLFAFLMNRLSVSYGPQGLNCTGLIGGANIVTLYVDGLGGIVDGQINFAAMVAPIPNDGDTCAVKTASNVFNIFVVIALQVAVLIVLFL